MGDYGQEWAAKEGLGAKTSKINESKGEKRGPEGPLSRISQKESKNNRLGLQVAA